MVALSPVVTARNQQAHTAVDLTIDEVAHACFVNRAVAIERRNQRRRASRASSQASSSLLLAFRRFETLR
jgi:hypothetical protein